MQLSWWDSQSGALFTSSSGMSAQAWWCHRHGNSLCLRLQNQTLRCLQEAAAIHQKSKFFIIRPRGTIKPYTSHTFTPLLKQLLHRPLMCMCVCIYSMHSLVPVWNHACISVHVTTVCVRVTEVEVGDLAHYLRHQPDSPRAGLKAVYWGPGGWRVWWLRCWLDSCLNRCITHS